MEEYLAEKPLEADFKIVDYVQGLPRIAGFHILILKIKVFKRLRFGIEGECIRHIKIVTDNYSHGVS